MQGRHWPERGTELPLGAVESRVIAAGKSSGCPVPDTTKNETPPAVNRGRPCMALVSVTVVMTGVLILVLDYFLHDRRLGGEDHPRDRRGVQHRRPGDLARRHQGPPPGMMPSSTTALAAATASSTLSLRSLAPSW